MQTIAYRGHTLTWEEHSPGDHTFIFIHGYSGNRAIWGYEVAQFRDLGRCVTLDLPGHFPAQAPSQYKTLTQEELLDLEAHAIKAICGDGKATLIGHSTGGMVALAVAARLPATVSRAISIGGVIWGPLTGLLHRMQWVVRFRLMMIYERPYIETQQSVEKLMQGIAHTYVYDSQSLLKNEVAWNVCRNWFPIYRQSSLHNFSVLLTTLETCNIRPLINGLETPVLVLAGAHDPVVSPSQSRWVFTHLPNADLHIFERTGHMVQWEEIERTHTVIRAWLQRYPV